LRANSASCFLCANADAPRYRTNGFAIELATQHRLVDALARALSLISEYTPFVLIVDDLQRADAPSLALLQALLPELSRTRVLVVATLSHERRAVRNPALRHLLGHGNCTRMELRPLHETEVASYVLAQLRGAPNALCRSVSDKSAGNPFLMAMLVRHLRRADLTEPSQLELPTALLALVLDRFAVDDTTRELLSVAAVIGRRFSLSLLQATTGRDARSLMALLDEAVTDALIMPVRDAHTEFEFKHELLRDALYETIEASERRTWHSRAGDVLEQRQACAQRTAIAIADHVRAAYPEGDLPRMVVRCIEAANASAEMRSFADSAHYLRCAQEAIAWMEASSHPRCASSSARPAADGGGERNGVSGSCSPEHPAAWEHAAHTPAAE
jgi:predicted ATPase